MATADGHQFFEVSAVTGKGLDSLVEATAQMVQQLRKDVVVDSDQTDDSVLWERSRQRRDRAIHIERESRGVWRVTGGAIERMVVQTDWENDEAVLYLQHRFDRAHLTERLQKAGVQPGDEVRILGFAFEFKGDEPHKDQFNELRDSDDEVLSELEEGEE